MTLTRTRPATSRPITLDALVRCGLLASLVALATSWGGARAQAQELEDWKIETERFQHPLGANTVIRVRNPHGDVRCRAIRGDQLDIAAVIQKHEDDPLEPDVEVSEVNGELTVRVTYPEKPDRAAAPADRSFSKRRVDLTVYVPDTARLDAETEHGLIEAKGVALHVRAHSSTGNIVIWNAGGADARTERGSIDLKLSQGDWPDEQRLETLSGNVTVQLPDAAHLTIEAQTQGQITTDYSVEIERQPPRATKHAKAVIGNGTKRLEISTVRGMVALFSPQS